LVDAWPELWVLLVTIDLLYEPVLYSCVQYKCAAVSLGVYKMKKLVKMM
jgi:hypothetical protein